MKQFAFLLIACFLYLCNATPLLAGTDIPGGDVDGTWTLDNAPYTIMGEITIPDGLTLIIEPGVDVIFAGHYKFNINGQLLAEGTAESIITFTATNSETGWHGLRFDSISTTNDTSKLVYCKIQHGVHQQSTPQERAGGGVTVEGTDKLLIAFCEIISNKTTGDIFSGGAGMVVSDCAPIITQNWFADNDAEGGHGGGLALIEGANPVITNNVFINNTALGGGAIVVSKCEPVFINNTITQNSADHGGGIDCIHGSPTFINTIIYGNSASVMGDEVHLATLDNLDYPINFLYCDLAGGVSAIANTNCANCIGIYEYNIEIDPQFVNASNDFHLMDTSPCIGAGTASVDVDGIVYNAPGIDFLGLDRPQPAGTAPDLGAIETEFAIPVGINNPDQLGVATLLNIYPNPTKSEVWIPYYTPISGKVSIEILNSLGIRVATLSNEYHNAGEYIIEWETINLPNGIYICVMKMEGVLSSKKIVVEK